MLDATIFSKSVKEKRREKGLTQEALARKAGIGLNTLKKVEAENSAHSQTYDTMIRIADALGSPLSVLTGEEVDFQSLTVVMRLVLAKLEARAA